MTRSILIPFVFVLMAADALAEVSAGNPTLSLDGHFRRGCWTTLDVELKNEGGHMQAVAEFVVDDILVFKRQVELPARSMTRLSTPILFNSSTPRLMLRVISTERTILEEALDIQHLEVPPARPFVILDRDAPWAKSAHESLSKENLAWTCLLSAEEISHQRDALEAVDAILCGSETFLSQITSSHAFMLWKAKGGIARCATNEEECLGFARELQVSHPEVETVKAEVVGIFDFPGMPLPLASRIIGFVLIYCVSASILIVFSFTRLKRALAILCVLSLASAGASAMVFLLVMSGSGAVCEIVSIQSISPEGKCLQRTYLSLSAVSPCEMDVTMVGEGRLRPLYYHLSDAREEPIVFEVSADSRKVRVPLGPNVLRCFEFETASAGARLIRLTSRESAGQLKYLVTNESAMDLDRVALVYAQNAWRIGRLEHGGSAEVSQAMKSISAGEYLSSDFDTRQRGAAYQRRLLEPSLRLPRHPDAIIIVATVSHPPPVSPLKSDNFAHVEIFQSVLLVLERDSR